MTTPLNVQDLFQPQPSGVGPNGQQNAATGTWLGDLLNVAGKVGLPTTAWQPTGPERTILATVAVEFATSDTDISIMAQGGFLGPAASGTVTTTTQDGTTVTIPVTPDPSNPAQNPTGKLGWLDSTALYTYGVTRLTPSAASGNLAIANLKGSSVGPYAAGAYHATNAETGATYSNSGALSIPSSLIGGAGGVVSDVSPGVSTTTITTSAAHGLAAGDAVYIVVPTTSGIVGLVGVFALVSATTSTTFQVPIGSTGTYTAGGNVYLCTLAPIAADTAGTAGSAAPGAISIALTANAQVYVSNPTALTGSAWESNPALAARTGLSLASRSPNGPSQAYVYFADTAAQLLAAQTPPYVLTNGPVTASSSGNPQTGVQTTTVASLSPASSVLGAAVTPGCSQLPISGVSNANPAVISCTGPTSLAPAGTMTVIVSGVLGVSGVNGTFTGTYVTATSFSIPIDTTAAGTFTGGGSVEGGDLGVIDQLLQDNVTPDNVTSITVSALALPVTVAAQVIVPQAFVATYQAQAPVQLQTIVSAYSVGGNAPAFAVAYDDVVGALEEAGVLTLGSASYVRNIASLVITVGGVTVPVGGSVPFPSNQYQAILVTPSVGVVGV